MPNLLKWHMLYRFYFLLSHNYSHEVKNFTFSYMWYQKRSEEFQIQDYLCNSNTYDLELKQDLNMLYVISKSTTGNGNRASWDVVSSNFLCFYLEYCCRNCNSNTWRLLLNNPSSSPVLSWHYYLIINRLMIVWIFMRPRGEVCMCVLLQYNRVAVIPFPCPCKQQNELMVSHAVCWVNEGHWL